jgi:hypothetical protein
MAAASAAATASKRKIARLKREIERIDAFFYTISPNDAEWVWTLELKRDNMVRAMGTGLTQSRRLEEFGHEYADLYLKLFLKD